MEGSHWKSEKKKTPNHERCYYSKAFRQLQTRMQRFTNAGRGTSSPQFSSLKRHRKHRAWKRVGKRVRKFFLKYGKMSNKEETFVQKLGLWRKFWRGEKERLTQAKTRSCHGAVAQLAHRNRSALLYSQLYWSAQTFQSLSRPSWAINQAPER